jgi:hypothetical protein
MTDQVRFRCQILRAGRGDLRAMGSRLAVKLEDPLLEEEQAELERLVQELLTPRADNDESSGAYWKPQVFAPPKRPTRFRVCRLC